MQRPSAAAGADLGLRFGLGAFLAFVLAPLLPLALLLLFAVLGVAAASLLHRDARARGGPVARKGAALGLALVVGGLVAQLAGLQALSGGAGADAAAFAAVAWVLFAGEVTAAGGFYLAVAHLAAERSRLLLGLALGAALAVSVAGAVATQSADPGALESAALARGVPYILFAWAYATILGRLRRGVAGAAAAAEQERAEAP